MDRHPFACGAERFGKLHLTHRSGHIGAQLGGAVVALDCGDVQPLVSGDEIDLATTAGRIHQTHFAEDIGAVVFATHAFLVPAPTVAQRIVRAKNRIRTEKIPYEVPVGAELPERLDRVLHVIYLVFNEGYSASSGNTIVRADLTAEAIRLARLLATLLPHPDVSGLLSLLLLQESRRAARQDGDGALVLLADQDRSRWDRTKIAEGLSLLSIAMQTFRREGARRGGSHEDLSFDIQRERSWFTGF